MVARIMIGENISGAIVYNEKKVAESLASGLLAHSYPDDFSNLNFTQKLPAASLKPVILMAYYWQTMYLRSGVCLNAYREVAKVIYAKAH
ncbi:hypothetical protein [Chitinophaga eiseniae]|uniref:Uncharacterized protein n=1 Tax=Chitinophaga eiseniae TaxID=634771 RepID=A0A847S446_9BACT|nr:hypothetical protein [Chitinophaga eiseniae]NLR78070.1 hypothetical protein [Chitinophaga eiseniae]